MIESGILPEGAVQLVCGEPEIFWIMFRMEILFYLQVLRQQEEN
jgi:hypothetical protein